MNQEVLIKSERGLKSLVFIFLDITRYSHPIFFVIVVVVVLKDGT